MQKNVVKNSDRSTKNCANNKVQPINLIDTNKQDKENQLFKNVEIQHSVKILQETTDFSQKELTSTATYINFSI